MPQFTKGSSGNPRGRPRGSRNHTGLAVRLDKMVTAEAEAFATEFAAEEEADVLAA
jgi:hypothetical protein